MAKHILMAFSDPRPGADAEFNKWYDEIHLQEILAVKGYVSAQRFYVSDAQMVGRAGPTHKYLAIYEIETDDLEQTLADLNDAARHMYVHPAVDRSNTLACVFHPIGERVEPA
jgi:hypothetical protein